MEWVESTGKTIDAAKDVALDRLGVHEDDAEFEILAEAKLGLFGRVKEDARVRARVRPTTPRAKEDRNRRQRGRGRGSRDSGARQARGSSGAGRDRGPSRETGSDRAGGGGGSGRGRGGGGSRARGGDRATTAERNTVGQGSSADADRSRDNDGRSRGESGGAGRSERRSRPDRKSREKSVNEDQPMMPLSEQADIAQAFVAGLAERFGADVTFNRTDVDDDIHLTVNGEDLGRMIGRRGTTAMAIDELVRTVLQRQAGSSRNGRIRVDIGGVRARRTEALTEFCRELAEQVRESGIAKALEPMGAADRKIVHDVINDEDDVDTVSEGEDPHRRVVIVPVGDAD